MVIAIIQKYPCNILKFHRGPSIKKIYFARIFNKKFETLVLFNVPPLTGR